MPKSSDTPKVVYSDKPRYQVIYGYENAFKNMFGKVIKAMAHDIEVKAKEMIKKK